jgi:hypothetical protein
MRHTAEEKKMFMGQMRELAKTIGRMTEEEQRKLSNECFITTCEGHPLSLFNNAFLSSQSNGTPLTIVGGYKQWERQGRRVIKGNHTVGYIYVPVKVKVKDNEETEERERKQLKFRLVPVFDVSQTEEI